jgi:hypothetical protein
VTDARSARSFDRSSPVHAYWLAHCEGFAVRTGRREGVVEEVELDLAQERAAALVVRYGPLKRIRLAPESVDVVVPDEELLVVPAAEAPPPRVAPLASQARERASVSARAGAHATGRAGSAFGHTVAAVAAAVWFATRRAGSWTRTTLWPAVRRGSSAAWHHTVLASIAVARATRRGAAAARRELQRFGAWLSPRAAALGRRTATGTRAAAATAVAWASSVADAVARWVRTNGPPARRAAGRLVSSGVASVRPAPAEHGPSSEPEPVEQPELEPAPLPERRPRQPRRPTTAAKPKAAKPKSAAAKPKPRPTRTRTRSDAGLAPREQRQGEDADGGGGAGELYVQPADADDVDEREHTRPQRKRAGRQA